jgi:hypothetical protein
MESQVITARLAVVFDFTDYELAWPKDIFATELRALAGGRREHPSGPTG